MKIVSFLILFVLCIQISDAQEWGGCDYYTDCDCIVALTQNGTLLHMKVTNQLTQTPVNTIGLLTLVKPWPKLPPFDGGQFTNYVGFARREPDTTLTQCRPLRFYTTARMQDQSVHLIEFVDTRNTTFGIESRIKQRDFPLNFQFMGGQPVASSGIIMKGITIVQDTAYILLTLNDQLHIGKFPMSNLGAPVMINPISAFNGSNVEVPVDITTLGTLFLPNGSVEAVAYDRITHLPQTVFIFDRPASIRPRNMTLSAPAMIDFSLSAIMDNSVIARGIGFVNGFTFVARLKVENTTFSLFGGEKIIGADYQCQYGRNFSCPNIMPDQIMPGPTPDNIDSEPSGESNNNGDKSLVIGLVVGIVSAVAIVGLLVAFLLVRKNKKKQSEKEKLGEFQGDIKQSGRTDRSQSSVELINHGAIEDVVITNKIGSGQFGDVYKGIWQGTTDCAIKKLKKNAGFEDFITEAKILSKLSHPNIVRLFGIFTDSEDNLNMVTEYMAKGSLLHLLQSERKTLTLSDLLKIARDSAAGMKYLESKSIIHRDLAARNLLVKQEDGRLVVKVADFGLSKVAESSYYSSSNSLFPIKWSPPEVVNYRKFTHKSDVWSFGIVLWEITEYGKVPYPSKSNDETMAAVLAGYRLPKPESCPEALYTIMLECWQEDPDKRPTFEDLFKRISALINEIEGAEAKEKKIVDDVIVPIEESEAPYNTDNQNPSVSPYVNISTSNVYQNDPKEDDQPNDSEKDYGFSPI